MQMDKLFHVLVIGGALLSTGAIANQDGGEVEVQEPVVGFCTDKEQMCDLSPDGQWTVKEGFVCCWGTSCEE